MSVRCPQCFYENEERYRFCGMCGIALPRLGFASEPEVRVGRPVAAAINSHKEPTAIPASVPAREPEKERIQIPVTGPSFLGLSQDQNPYPDRSLDYLLEDEPHPGRARTYLAIVLLLAAAAMLGWRWRHSGFFSEIRRAAVTTLNGKPADSPSTAPADSPNTSQADSPASPSGVPAAASSNAQTATNSPPAQAQRSSPQESDIPPGASANQTAKPSQSGEINAAGSDDSANAAAIPDTSSTPAATTVPVEKPPALTPPAAKATAKVSPATAPAMAVPAPEQDPLEMEGERYLYGSGVPQNCGRAEKSLLAAAQHANPKAQSVLGTMYATGHCVGRDLPTAYRWFARASHQDPSNARITRDLEVLWRQMTAGERQLAVNNRE
jgi:hypothetical protein